MIEHPKTLFKEKKSFCGVDEAVQFNPTPVVIVFDSNTDSLPHQEKEQLIKILAALKLKEEDVVLIAQRLYNTSIAQLKKQLKATHLLVFSNNPNAVGKNFKLPLFEIVELDGVQIIRSAPLMKIMHDNQLKAVLWNKLKLMFSLK